MQTSYPRAKIPYLSLLIILALINQPYLESLPVTRASEVIATSKPIGNGQWAMGNGQKNINFLLKPYIHALNSQNNFYFHLAMFRYSEIFLF
jgi:hypothetical protein